MASKRAVSAALKLLAVNFAGEVTDEKAKLWAAALRDVTDEQLAQAVPDVIRTHRGEFIPPVAVIRDAAGANRAEAVDVERVLKAIEQLGSYSPTSGWSAPRIRHVSEHLGAAIGEAYAMAGGGGRLFAQGSDVTRDIAARDFQQALTAASRVHRIPPAYRVSPPVAAEALPAGAVPLLGDGQ